MATGVLVGLVGLAGCGGGSDEVVVRVAGGEPIMKSMVDRWIGVDAIVSSTELPTGPAPKGLIPDPPDYTACVAYSRTHAFEGVAHGNATDGQLREGCRKRYAQLKEMALTTLISWDWLIAAGRKAGFSVSEAEVLQQLHIIEKRLPSGVTFVDYLRFTNQTSSDVRKHSRAIAFEEQLNHHVLEAAAHLPKTLTSQQRQAAGQQLLARYSASGPAWIAKTDCSRGYVAPSCRQAGG